MATPTDDDLRALFLNPEMYWGVNLSRSGERIVAVDEVIHHARERWPNEPELERLIDGYVARVGGKRLSASSLSNKLRRLLGREPKPTAYLYELPAHFFGVRIGIADQFKLPTQAMRAKATRIQRGKDST